MGKEKIGWSCLQCICINCIVFIFNSAFIFKTVRLEMYSFVPCPRTPPGEKRSGERSRVPWAYYPKRVMTNEIARSVIIT